MLKRSPQRRNGLPDVPRLPNSYETLLHASSPLPSPPPPPMAYGKRIIGLRCPVGDHARHSSERLFLLPLRRRNDDDIYTGERCEAAVPLHTQHVALSPFAAKQRRRNSRDTGNGDRTMTTRKEGAKG